MIMLNRCDEGYSNWSDLSPNQQWTVEVLDFVAPIMNTLAKVLFIFKMPTLTAVEKKREDCAIQTDYLTEWELNFNVWRNYLLAGAAVILLGIGLFLLIVIVILVISLCSFLICCCGTTIGMIVISIFPCFSFCVKRRVKKQRIIEKQRLLQGLLEDKEMDGIIDDNENKEQKNPFEKIDISILNLNFEDYKIEKEIGK